MGSGITFWGRVGDAGTLDAQRFLKQNGYGADRILDIDRDPPAGDDWMRLAKGLGGSLSALVDLRHPDASQAPTEADVQPWLAADAARIRAPILLTPKGALVGFRERAWREFLDIGRGR